MLLNNCTSLKGIGQNISEKLAKCGISTIQDLIFHLPFKYQDKTRITAIRDLRAHDWAVIFGTVCKTEIKNGRRRSLHCHIEDHTGIFSIRFFNFNKQQIKNLTESKQIIVFGEVREFTNTLYMTHPEYKLFDEKTTPSVEQTLTPIYPSTNGLSQNRLRKIINLALDDYAEHIHSLEWMSEDELKKHNFQPIQEALINLHNPPPDLILQELEDGSHKGLQRVVFDELLAKRLSMQFAKNERLKLKAYRIIAQQDFLNEFINNLPFKLTAAQTNVYNEIKNDLNKQTPMLRLVQGDVGSGKTIVAALAALQVIKCGYQVALMAPTDILTEQHEKNISKWFARFNINVIRLTGKMKIKERREAIAKIDNNTAQLIIGTHALFQSEVKFAKLGLIIIDEQHRFGVEQRSLLQQKGQYGEFSPHQLLMTATPIPRTLAMTSYSHLDLSAINELPPGRTEITTAVLAEDKQELIIERLGLAIQSNRQAYWVCTLIDESENLECIAATNRAAELQKSIPFAKIGLIHGKLKPQEKENVMAAFKNGNLDLLVATTVIEVGVDVANASLMIIENAERLGLSQLHQLRGRVGRGNTKSHCLLLYHSPLSTVGRERLKVMRETSNGFIIAEKDLELRGYGEFLGKQQTGYQKFKVANIQRDSKLLPKITKTAAELSKKDPTVSKQITKRWLGEYEHFIVS
ncbi:MAG: ATP-dependent DNA helicase RecG [Legionellales bacterium RIFCSPHIGHO2_12_FULL_35_11]|nr:MAG: ATP-dependent DNA helicase RecG [Legionellales bacterium RIFCSPHIGHO2_12_FULL_35_11]